MPGKVLDNQSRSLQLFELLVVTPTKLPVNDLGGKNGKLKYAKNKFYLSKKVFESTRKCLRKSLKFMFTLKRPEIFHLLLAQNRFKSTFFLKKKKGS